MNEIKPEKAWGAGLEDSGGSPSMRRFDAPKVPELVIPKTLAEAFHITTPVPVTTSVVVHYNTGNETLNELKSIAAIAKRYYAEMAVFDLGQGLGLNFVGDLETRLNQLITKIESETANGV